MRIRVKPSMSKVIPSLDSVTPEWLTSRLRKNGKMGKGRILDVKIRPNPAFNSIAAHLEPVYSADAPADVPERLFIKIKQHHWGRDEVSFYRLATEQKRPLPMLIPFIDGAYDEDTGVSHCLMLDVSGTHHAPVSRARLLAGDGVPEEGELAGCVDALAGLHAYWWEHPALGDGPALGDSPVRNPTPFRNEESYMAEVRDQAEEWRRFSASAGAELPRELVELYDSRIVALPTLWDRYLKHRIARFSKLTPLRDISPRSRGGRDRTSPLPPPSGGGRGRRQRGAPCALRRACPPLSLRDISPRSRGGRDRTSPLPPRERGRGSNATPPTP